MTRDFQFEDLPLFITGGYETAQVNGTVAISYHRDGDWAIDGIWLDGFKRGPRTAADYCKPVQIDAGTPLYMMVYDALETERRHEIEDFVWQMIEADQSTGRESRERLRLVPAE